MDTETPRLQSSISCQIASMKVSIQNDLDRILNKHRNVPGASVSVIKGYQIQNFVSGYARTKTETVLTDKHFMQCASLSKTVAAAFAYEYFGKKNISMNTPVNEVLSHFNSEWLIKSNSHLFNADEVTLSMLLNHTALGMHYVYGIPIAGELPSPLQLLDGTCSNLGYKTLLLERPAGKTFAYSGGGFVVMQYLLELMEEASIDDITRSFLNDCGLKNFTFTQLLAPVNTPIAFGHMTPNQEVAPLAFPPLAAGALCTPSALASFLCHLSDAYHNELGSGSISHRTAQCMLGSDSLLDLGAFDFMGAKV